MQSIFRALLVLAVMAPGLAAAADLDDMLSDALRKFRAGIAGYKTDIKKVAVYAIEPDKEGKINVSILQDQMEAALIESERFGVINRKSLKALLEEQALSLTGVVDEAQMVKAGKLVGAQGFFYGSVEIQKNKLILTVKLIEVETSIVVASRKYIGESRSFARLGIGYFYGMAPGLSMNYRVFHKAMNNVEYPLSPASDQLTGIAASSPLSFALSYRQGFQSLSFAQLGLDIALAAYMPATEKAASTDGETSPIDSGNLVYQATVALGTATTISFTPKIYFVTRDLFGFNRDVLNPYIGAMVAMTFIETRFSGWGRHEFAGEEGGYKELKRSTAVTAIAPVVGIEANVTNSLSAYAEAAYLASDAMPAEDVVGLYIPENLHAKMEAFMPKGLFVNVGIKYYFNLF